MAEESQMELVMMMPFIETKEEFWKKAPKAFPEMTKEEMEQLAKDLELKYKRQS